MIRGPFMGEHVFHDYGLFYDLLYRDKDYAAEAEYIVRTLRVSDRHAHTLLEFGSGTGRHGSLLAQQGFDVLGVQRSESMRSMLNAAAFTNAGGGTFSCLQGDLRTMELNRIFDAALALFHVVSYQIG